MSKLLSDNERVYYKSVLQSIVNALEKCSPAYTHHFESIGHMCIKGKDNRPLLRRMLRTLEADGIVENIDLGCNTHKWKLIKKAQSPCQN